MNYKLNRRDGNESEIIEYVEKCGFVVKQARSPAAFDWYVKRRGSLLVAFLEIKTKLAKLTANEDEFKRWAGSAYIVARTPEEAVTKLEQLRWN